MSVCNQNRLDEFIGLAKGILADGVLVDSEIKCLMDWINLNPEYKNKFPVSILSDELKKIDRRNITEKDKNLVFEILQEITYIGESMRNEPAPLPLDATQPDVKTENHSFLLTGIFRYGPRVTIEKIITSKSGTICDKVTQNLDYLVVGEMISRDWARSSYGKIIEAAAEQRNKTGTPKIISEETLIKSL